MRFRIAGVVAGVMVGAAAAALAGQSDAIDRHVKAAEAAAGKEYNGLFHQLCDPPAPPAARQGQPPAARGLGGGRGTPDRASWYAEPVKVFDNLYFLGQTEFSVWAVNTSEGIILVDTIFDYSVEAEVIDGLKKLGLDPKKIKYAIVSHAHADHSGGAKFLQERGVRIIMSAADWDLNEKGPEPKAKRDMIATDGMKVRLGDTSLTVYLTPGHTQGTISTLIPVKDNGQPHLAALWGGTMFNWLRGGAAYITPATPASYWFETYSTSARKFRDIVDRNKADVLLSNHTAFDNSKTKLPAVQSRKPGAPNPYVVGTDSIKRYLTMADECAKAGLLRSEKP
jgi:metallo-beta-lactamase class B